MVGCSFPLLSFVFSAVQQLGGELSSQRREREQPLPYNPGVRRWLRQEKQTTVAETGYLPACPLSGIGLTLTEEALMPRTLACLLLLLFPWPALGQNSRLASGAEERRKGRARIGVALEGGGALGLAHIGVLEWFEEHHIPVDYVAGTSMGGLVGGFYATGRSPAELKKLIEGVDWTEILVDATPYEDLSYRRKEDQRAYPNAFILGLRKGLSLPGGLNSGHQLAC